MSLFDEPLRELSLSDSALTLRIRWSRCNALGAPWSISHQLKLSELRLLKP